MPPRACTVSFTDAGGVSHSVEVEGESLYEAAALGVARLKRDGWVEAIGPGTRLEITVREPSTRHVISLQQLQTWINSVATSPAETLKRARLKGFLNSSSRSER